MSITPASVISASAISATAISASAPKLIDYTAYAILKSSEKIDADNLMYEYIVGKFINKNGDKYFTQPHNINGIDYPPYNLFFEKIDFNKFNSNSFYKLFHGDLQFDNVIYNSKENKFTYIDWRESFGGYTDSGDIYYDLAKLYGGCIIPYNKMKNENNIIFVEGEYSVKYSYDISNNLNLFKNEFENWIVDMGFDLNKVKLTTALIFLNMSPLHDEKFSKMLWFKSIEMLYELTNK